MKNMSVRLCRVLLVMALLLAQQAGLSHGVWHMSNASQAWTTELQAAALGAQQRLCAFHEAFDTVLGALSSMLAAAPAFLQAARRFSSFAVSLAGIPTPHPSSRDPPIVA